MRLTRDWELSSSENKRWKPNGQRRDWSKLPFEVGANSIKATDYGGKSCVDDSESQFEAKFKSSAQCAKSGSCLDY